MDEAELESLEVELTRATREYGWFAIVLICIIAMLVFKLRS